jgi:hypothetical protein
VTLGSTVQAEFIVEFPLQQWLRERATVLRYTYTSCDVQRFDWKPLGLKRLKILTSAFVSLLSDEL